MYDSMIRLKDSNGKWSKASKVTGTIASIVVVISTIGGVGYRVADANTWDKELFAQQEQLVQTLEMFKEKQRRDDCRDIVRELNRLKAKEREEGLSEYDLQYRDQLLADKEETCGS